MTGENMKNPIVKAWTITLVCFIFFWPAGLIALCVSLYMTIRNLLIDVKKQEAMKKEVDMVRKSNEILLHLIQDEHREEGDR